MRRFCFWLIVVTCKCDLKLLCPSQLRGLKDQKSKSEFELKKNIGEEMKMFQKYQLANWLSMQNFYLHFTKVTRKCIVEPCVFIHDLEIYNQFKY